MEVTGLKCNTVLRVKFEKLPVIPTADGTAQFWKFFLSLRKFAMQNVSVILQYLSRSTILFISETNRGQTTCVHGYS